MFCSPGILSGETYVFVVLEFYQESVIFMIRVSLWSENRRRKPVTRIIVVEQGGLLVCILVLYNDIGIDHYIVRIDKKGTEDGIF